MGLDGYGVGNFLARIPGDIQRSLAVLAIIEQGTESVVRNRRMIPPRLAQHFARQPAHARYVVPDALHERCVVEAVVERAVHLMEPVDRPLVEEAAVRLQGLGVALGRLTLMRPMVESGRLVTLFEERLKSEFAHYLVFPERSERHRGLHAFRDWLLEEAQAYVESDECVRARAAGMA